MNLPKIFLAANISFGTPKDERVTARIALLNALKAAYGETMEGVWVLYQWREIATTADIARELLPILDWCMQNDKTCILQMRDRNFGSDKYTVPVIPSLDAAASYYNNGIHSKAIWASGYHAAQIGWVRESLVPALQGCEATCVLEELQWGESSIAIVGNTTHVEYGRRLAVMYNEMAGILASVNVAVGANINWLDGLDKVQTLVNDLDPAVRLGTPDTAPGMFIPSAGGYNPDTPVPSRNKIHALQVFADLVGRDATNASRMSPHMESYDMRPEDYYESIMLCATRLKATRIMIQTSFDSRVSKPAIGWPDFAPTLKAQIIKAWAAIAVMNGDREPPIGTGTGIHDVPVDGTATLMSLRDQLTSALADIDSVLKRIVP